MRHKTPINKSSFLLTDGALAEWVASQKLDGVPGSTFQNSGVQELKDAATARDTVREVKWNLTPKARQGHGSEKLTDFLSVPRRTFA